MIFKNLLLTMLFLGLSSSTLASKKNHQGRYNEFAAIFNAALDISENSAELLKFNTEWECWTIGPYACDFGYYHGPKVRYIFAKNTDTMGFLPFVLDERDGRSLVILNQKKRTYEDSQFYFSKMGLTSMGQKTWIRITKGGSLITKSELCGYHTNCGARYSLCRTRIPADMDYENF